MKRRDFMKMAAVAPAGMVVAEEKDEKMRFEFTFKHDIFHFIFCEDIDFPAYCEALEGLWRNNRKMTTTIHKDGLDVRFV